MNSEQKVTIHPNYEPEMVVNEHCGCGENPLYDAASGTLYWCDIGNGSIWALDVSSGAHRLIYRGAECGAFTLQSDGNLLLLPGHDALILDVKSGETTPVKSEIVSDTGRFNDCIVDPKGRIFAGTVDWEQQIRGALFGLGLSLEPTQICSGTACSNGMAWTPDGRGLFWADSTAKTIYLFDHEAQSGALSNRKVWLHTPDSTPDGLTIDIEGNLWITQFGDGCVRQYDVQAQLVRQVDLPAANVTSCIFGGPDFGDLYITTAAQSAKNDPLGGALFRIRPEIGGKDEFRSRVGIS